MMKVVLLFAFALLVSPLLVFGQATSGVTGVATDASGAVVPGVKVTLTDTKTDRELTTVTNDQGSYTFNNVQPGSGYKLSFSGQGFQTLVISSVTLGVAKTETFDATLTAGDVSATVDVVASGSGETLNTTDASIGNVIDTRQLRELPIQIRSSPAALIGLQPGVVGNNVGTATTNRVGSVTGSRADQGNITVDGIDANDQTTGQAFATVGNAPIDAIQEFRATTVNPASAQGRSSGGQVDLVTKSGTNQWHGSLYEYNRNEKFAANSFFNNRSGVRRPKLNRNQFGGSIGGPLPYPNFGENNGPLFKSGKDRLFFFFNYEGRRDAQGVSYLRTVPLDHFRNGSVGYINNTAGCATNSRLNTTPQCITILTPAQVAAIDPRGVGANAALLSFVNSRYPHANDLTAGDGINTGGFRFNAPASRKDATYTTRFDGNLTDKQKLFARFNIARRDQTDTVNTVAAQFPGDPEPSKIIVRDWSLAGGHSWVITNSLFNQITVGNSHSGLDFPALFAPAFPQSFTFMGSPAGAGLSAPYASISSQDRIVDTPTIRDDVTWTTGDHTVLFGAQIKPIRSQSGITNDFNFVTIGLGGNTNTLNTALRPANIRTGTTAAAAYDRAFAFMLGRIGQNATNFNYSATGEPFAPGTGKHRDFRYNEYEFYVQDNWKIRSDLTINLGVRYQYYEPPYEANGFQAANDVDWEELFNVRLANGPAGRGGDTAEPLLTYDLIGKANDGRPYYKPDKNNWAPRVGFAYAPSFKDGIGRTIFGDRQTSIRGGWTLQYERVGGGLTFIQDQGTYLFDNSATLAFGGGNASSALLNDPRFVGLTTGIPQNTPPVITRPFTPFVDSHGAPIGNATSEFNYTLAQDFQVPYSYQYSIGVQRELPGNMLIDVSYVGRKGRKLFTQADLAQVIDFKDPASGQTLFGALNSIQAGSNATQPFLENQGALALGAPCTSIPWQSFGFPSTVTNCTSYAAFNYGSLIAIGDSGDVVQGLFADGLLRSNVGISGQFSDNIYITNHGYSNYDALLVSLQKRFSQGFQFDFNYTYSFSKDNNSSVVNTVIGGLLYDLRDPNIGYGPSDFDIRHLINVNGIWELPIGRGRWIGSDMPGWLDAIVGGFQMSGIYTYRSGLPFSTTTGSFPVSFTLNTPGVFTGSQGDLAQGIDASGATVRFFADRDAALGAFRNVTAGESGTRNNLRGPSFWNVDLSLAKNFRLPWEGHRLQLRMDMFNAFNKNFFGLPSVNINAASFGDITTSASSPREIQFAVRYDF
jgi:hypothetical protein